MTMESIKLCTDLNAYAIDLMKEGKCTESVRAFRKALQQLQTSFPADEDATMALQVPLVVDNDDQDAQGCGPSSFSSIPLDDVVSQVETHNVMKDNIFDFCPRMFYVSFQDAMQLGIAKLLTIVLMNHAMARHIATLLHYLSPSSNKNIATTAMTASGAAAANPHTSLRAVFALYNKVLELGQTAFDRKDVQQMICVLAAAANNMGHISSQLYMFQETRSCVDIVIALLADAEDNCSIGMDDLNLFFRSICIFLEGPRLSISPAA